jgi:hypothetical protein
MRIDVPNNAKVASERDDRVLSVDVCDAVFVRLNVAQVADVTDSVGGGTVRLVRGVVVSARGGAAIRQIAVLTVAGVGRKSVINCPTPYGFDIRDYTYWTCQPLSALGSKPWTWPVILTGLP